MDKFLPIDDGEKSFDRFSFYHNGLNGHGFGHGYSFGHGNGAGTGDNFGISFGLNFNPFDENSSYIYGMISTVTKRR